jgi:hypothetical protein
MKKGINSKNKLISRYFFYLSSQTIRSSPQSRETIPLIQLPDQGTYYDIRQAHLLVRHHASALTAGYQIIAHLFRYSLAHLLQVPDKRRYLLTTTTPCLWNRRVVITDCRWEIGSKLYTWRWNNSFVPFYRLLRK